MTSDSEPDCYCGDDEYEDYPREEDYDDYEEIRRRFRKCEDFVRSLLKKETDVNITHKDGPNFLRGALFCSPVETVELVIRKLYVTYKNQEDFEVADDVQKCQKIVKFLLNQKVDLLFPDSKFSLLLFFALKFGDEETFKLVLQTDNQNFDIDALSPSQNPILHEAIRLKKLPHVNLLLDHGANIHLNGYNNQTSLHWAVAANNLQLVHYLLQHGVDANAKINDYNFTAFHYAVAVGSKAIAESLLDAGADLQAEFRNENWLIWKNSSVLNIVSGCTKLNTLSSGIIQSKGCDPKVKFDIEMMQFLLERGAKTEIKDYRSKGCGLTPLERACQAGRMDVLQLLAKYQANFNRVNDEGCTMFHHAVIGGNVEIIDLLLRMNLDINAKNQRGHPPLDYAADKNAKIDAVPLIEFLVDNGANDDLKSLEDHFPKLPDVFQFLLESSDNFKFEKSQENWPLQSAGIRSYFVEITLNTELLIALMATMEIDINFDFTRRGKREFVDRFYQECKLEVLRMKSVKFCEDKLISLFDFLTIDLMKVTNFTMIIKIIENLESSDLVREYLHYAFLLEKRIGRVKTVLYFKDSIADFLEKYVMLKLPIDVVDYIFSYLRVGDIRNFARALSLAKKESKTGTLPLPNYLKSQCENIKDSIFNIEDFLFNIEDSLFNIDKVVRLLNLF